MKIIKTTLIAIDGCNEDIEIMTARGHDLFAVVSIAEFDPSGRPVTKLIHYWVKNELEQLDTEDDPSKWKLNRKLIPNLGKLVSRQTYRIITEICIPNLSPYQPNITFAVLCMFTEAELVEASKGPNMRMKGSILTKARIKELIAGLAKMGAALKK